MNEPEILYHYTSNQAFAQIVERKCLWLSGRHNQNDWREGQLFLELLRVVAEREGLSSHVDRVRDALTRFEPYISCFSSQGDQLSQWRGYADNAAGVSIGFRRASLIAMISGDTQTLLRPITYTSRADELPRQMTDLTVAMLKSNGTPSPEFVVSAAKVVWEVKSPCFAEESERRLIYIPPTDKEDADHRLSSGATIKRRHRAVTTGLREYCELSCDALMGSIAEVILGPRNDSNVEVVTRFLSAHGCEASVRPSQATYR